MTSLTERERVWWVGLATGTVGTWTTDGASVEAARAAGWRVEEFVPAATASGAVDALSDLLDALDDAPALPNDPTWAAIVKARGELRRLRGGSR